MAEVTSGRANQKRRTRQALLDAAARLMRNGSHAPTLEEVAEEALVSRATAYRYFAGVEALLVEAALDIAMPQGEDLFAESEQADAAKRLKRVDVAVDAIVHANEAAIRTMLVHSLQQKLTGANELDSLPARQNRRTALIEAALSPARGELDPRGAALLEKAAALIIGSESMLVFRDVLQLSDEAAREVKDWAIDALVEAARRP